VYGKTVRYKDKPDGNIDRQKRENDGQTDRKRKGWRNILSEKMSRRTDRRRIKEWIDIQLERHTDRRMERWKDGQIY
jgi:hypothetical protein